TLKYTEARPTPGVPSRIAQVAPQGPPAPVASLRAKGAPRRGRGPPMDDLDNPKRRSKGQPSDYTSANNYGFGAASTSGRRRRPGSSARDPIGFRCSSDYHHRPSTR